MILNSEEALKMLNNTRGKTSHDDRIYYSREALVEADKRYMDQMYTNNPKTM